MKALPIKAVQDYLGEQITILRGQKRPRALHMALSVSEYMKDAQRWRYFRDNLVAIPDGITPEGIEKYIDKELRK